MQCFARQWIRPGSVRDVLQRVVTTPPHRPSQPWLRTFASQHSLLEKVATSTAAPSQDVVQRKRKAKKPVRHESKQVDKPAKQDDTDLDPVPKPATVKEWMAHKVAMKKKFGDQGWNPRKKLSPDTMDGIRTMHASDPTRFSTPVLAEHFEVSPEAIRRILKSKWQPSADESEKRRQRWEKRGERIWTDLSEMGLKPPKPWRIMGVGRAAPGEVPKWRAARPSGQALAQRRPVRQLENTEVRRDIIATRADAGADSRGGTGSSIASRML